ncbi:hypothetical protein ACFOGJ_18020 [Marinibaculum pumilum]|uniref:Uncharacterized protein n=1 Tax=Marinibaculum pumilum TaxID=1766165 RepID=A0ABV7L3C4_9PROT
MDQQNPNPQQQAPAVPEPAPAPQPAPEPAPAAEPVRPAQDQGQNHQSQETRAPEPEHQQAQPEPEAEPNRPVDTLRDGNLKASIWRNEAESGAFYATTFSRTWRDQEGQLRDANNFVGSDLLKISELAREAYTRTNALRRDDFQERNADTDEEARRAAFKRERGSQAEQEPKQERDR